MLGFLCLLFGLVPVAGKDTWVSVRSKNFTLVGNAGEKEVRRVAVRLEQFRDAFTKLLQQAKFDTPVPTTVVVFKSKGSYQPFNPSNAAGYFQKGQDVNYITLTTESADGNPFDTIYHEYVHLLIDNNFSNIPVWFNEGLAEYYSTFRIEDDRKVYLGDLISNHLAYLRQGKLIPLRTLFAVDHDSPYYNEGQKRGIFYAEAWALVHYLLRGNNGQRSGQLNQFLGLLASGLTIDEAFQQAFQSDPSVLEKELQKYITGSNFMMQVATFERKLEFDNTLTVAPLTEGQAQAYLGDLLLHTHDLKGAEGRLQQALALAPDNSLANSALGVLRARQGRFAEAKQFLQKAVSADSGNYLAHYYYAYALSRPNNDGYITTESYSADTLATMRAELKQAIALAPTFPESYSLLAFINLVAGTELDESVTLLQRALTLSPGRQDLTFMLAQLYLRQQNIPLAKQTTESLVASAKDQRLRREAENLLASIKRFEEALARSQAGGGTVVTNNKGASGDGSRPALRRRTVEPTGTAPPQIEADSLYAAIRQALRPVGDGETRVQGWFTKLECDTRGTAYFILRTATRQYKIRAKSLAGTQLTAFTQLAGGMLTCGARQPEDNAIITFRATTDAKDAKAKIDGDAVAVELVPKDFQLNP